MAKKTTSRTREAVALAAFLILPGCTSTQDVIQDAGEARQVIKASIGRQVEAVGWRDMEILAVHRARNAALLRAAEDAVRADDMETAQELWNEALEALRAYQPVQEKIENIRRVVEAIKPPPKPGKAPMSP